MQCIVCRQTLASMLELQMHGKHHFQSPAAFYTCCVCLQSFESKDNLVSKLNTSGRTYYVCRPCYSGDMTSSAQRREFPGSDVISPQRGSVGVSPQRGSAGVSPSMEQDLRCPSCGVKCENPGALESHMTTHKKTFQCIKVSFIFRCCVLSIAKFYG